MISVIIPVYNVRDYLGNCVGSLLAQTYKNWEGLLVDDGSTDGSAELCDMLRKKDNRIRVIHKPNGGLSDARNAGLDAARGDYLVFVDSDDVIEPKALEVLKHKLESEQLDIVAGNVWLYDIKRQQKRTYPPLSIPHPRGVLDELWNTSACNKMYRREIFKNRRFIKGIKFEDMPMWADILFSGAKIGYVDEYVYQYNINRLGSIVALGDYRGYPASWQYWLDSLQKGGKCTSQVASAFCARITMKFIQAYNRSQPDTRREFYLKAQDVLRKCGKIGLSGEYGKAISLAVFVHSMACRLMPPWLYGFIFWPERIIMNPKLNDFLRRTLQSWNEVRQ